MSKHPKQHTINTGQLTGGVDYASEVDAFPDSLAVELEHPDPIRARRDTAVENLRRIGLLTAEQIGSVREDLERSLDFACKIVRVIRAVVESADGSERLVTRVIAGGYRQLSETVVDPAIVAIDIQDGVRNQLSDDARKRLWEMCANQDNPVYIAAGATDRYEADILEVLLATARDQGIPARDVNRPAEEPAVTGVREVGLLTVQSDYSLIA